MKIVLFFLCLSLAGLASDAFGAAESRTWTPSQGAPFTGTLLNVSADAVTVKREPDGQVLRLKLADCAIGDREYVAKIQTDAREAESFDAVVTGEIAWRLPPWSGLSWSTRQHAELWIWDEKAKALTEKVAGLTVEYTNSSKHNEFFGKYKSEGPVHLWKPAKYCIKARFQAGVNGEQKDLEQTSTPFVLPSPGKEGLNLITVRFSLTR